MLSGRVTDKLVFTAIYTLVALLVIWGGSGMANYALDTVFYRDYLLQWETALVALHYKQAVWPEFNTDNPMAYMQALVRQMQVNGIPSPRSNSEQAFIYRLNKIGEKPQHILLICSDHAIMMYNLPASTFDRLERFIDEQPDSQRGAFTGRWSADQITRIGRWEI